MRKPNARVSLFFTIVVLGLLPRVAQGQQPPAGPPPVREGSAEFAFVGTSGNASTQSLGLGGEFIYRPAPWEARLKVAFVRNESDDEVKAESLLLIARVQRAIAPRLAAFGQYGYQRDRFAGILDRNTVEGGLAYTVVDYAPHKLVVDGAFGYANEQRVTGDNISTGTFAVDGLYTLKISETSELTEDARFNFSLSESSDWRYANLLGLTAKISTFFSLKLSNAVRYVNLPAPGFKTTDVVTSIALVAKF